MPSNGPAGRTAHGALNAAIGLVTWLVAHAITHLLWSGVHTEPDHAAHLGSAATFVGVAVLGGLLATLGVLQKRRQATAGGSVWMALLSPLTFLIAELLTHAGSTHGVPPGELLVIGIAVHTVVGAVAPAILRRVVEHARAGIGALEWAPAQVIERAAAAVGLPQRTWVASTAVAGWGCRAPPPALALAA
ncbi:hypothetical protein [Pseudonocardia sp. TRM90224]|uniref:hypothetical protein n=1 Tax=Pseudonocardia sp. TRM90224 TaxID=2812678 RepID=UPI001E30EF19|nr:hypothetical protein [Pseudonocardia sp. TRM90224]